MIELEARTAKATKTEVVLYKTLDCDDGKYATACYGAPDNPHSGIVFHETRKDAVSWMPDPQSWCPDCQEKEEEQKIHCETTPSP